MAMWVFIAKNSSGSDQLIEDLGISIPDSGQETLSLQFTYDELAGSDDLRALVASGDLVANNGSADLSAADGVDYLTIVQQDHLTENHWTKTQLAATGGSSDRVDWSQVANAPAFGTPEWGDPVLYRASAIQSAAPAATHVGQIYVNTTEDKYYKWSGVAWVDQSDVADGDLVINLANAQEDVYQFVTDTWVEQAQSADNEARLVKDDGDGKQAQYVYSTVTGSWKKIGDVDFGDHVDDLANRHNADQIKVENAYTNIGSLADEDLETVLGDIDTVVGANATAAGDAATAASDAQSDIDDHIDGAASKHDASEIDVETAYANIGSDADDDLETVLSDIDTVLGGLDSGGSLDDSYDFGGAGLGRSVTVDSGPVKLDASGGTDAPLELTPKASAPTTNLAGGQLDVIGGELYVYDATRSKWLSVTRHTFAFGRKGKSKNQYLNFWAGELPSNNTGIRLPWNCTVTMLSAQIDATGTGTFTVRESGGTRTINLAITAALGNENVAASLDLNAGDLLECYLSSTAGVNDPVILIEIAKRK